MIVPILVGMTALGSAAVYHLDNKVDALLKETSKLQDRVTVIEEEPKTVIIIQPPKLSVEPTPERVSYKQIDVFCLAKNIYHEARGEPLKGKYAVAQVTLNRVKNKKYPDTICEVVMDPFQFSWANNRKIRWTHPKGKEWNESRQIAEKVLAKGYRVKGLEQANYYHADYVDPKWKKEESKIAKVGDHIFYSKAR